MKSIAIGLGIIGILLLNGLYISEVYTVLRKKDKPHWFTYVSAAVLIAEVGVILYHL